MAQDIVIYTVLHQPRRPKLPAQPIPEGAAPGDIERCLFDEQLNEQYLHKVATYCYYPATEMFLELADGGLKFSIGFSFSVIRPIRPFPPTGGASQRGARQRRAIS
jgi:alpha-amylase